MKKYDNKGINEHWERLSAVIEYAGMSTNYFARHIGLPVAENLYRIKRQQNGISRDVAERIVQKFPAISKGWLLTGEGDMFYNETVISSLVPYFEENAANALAGLATESAGYLSIPLVKGCDFAIKFADGDNEYILAIKEMSKDELTDGKEYLFLIKKILSLQKWNAGEIAELGDEDKVFAIGARLEIHECEQLI